MYMDKKILRPIIILLIFILVVSNINGIVLADTSSFGEWIDANKDILDEINKHECRAKLEIEDSQAKSMLQEGVICFVGLNVDDDLDEETIEEYIEYATIIKDKNGYYEDYVGEIYGDKNDTFTKRLDELEKKLKELENSKDGKTTETTETTETTDNSEGTAKIPSHWKNWPQCLPREVEGYAYDSNNFEVFKKVCDMYLNADPDPESEDESNDTVAKQWVMQLGEIMDQPGMYSYLQAQQEGISYRYQLIEKMRKVSKKRSINDEETKKVLEDNGATIDNDGTKTETPESIYHYPGQSENKTSAAGSLDDMIGDADKFIDNAGDSAISSQSLQDFSKKFYNIFLTIGVIISVLVGSVLGIKFMVGGAEEKAHIKELLVPYVVGCIAIFGAFAIWKIVVTILSNSFL